MEGVHGADAVCYRTVGVIGLRVMSTLQRECWFHIMKDKFKDCKTCAADCGARGAAFRPRELWPPCFLWESDGTLEVEEEKEENA